ADAVGVLERAGDRALGGDARALPARDGGALGRRAHGAALAHDHDGGARRGLRSVAGGGGGAQGGQRRRGAGDLGRGAPRGRDLVGTPRALRRAGARAPSGALSSAEPQVVAERRFGPLIVVLFLVLG